MNLAAINSELIAGNRLFRSFNPSVSSVLSNPFHQKAAKIVIAGAKTLVDYKEYKRTGDAAEFVGGFLGTRMIKKICKPVKTRVTRAHVIVNRTDHDLWRKNGIGGRTWYDTPHRERMVIVYHDANRAGPHIDVHLGRVSLVYRVKPELYSQLRYNSSGQLTQASRDAIIDHVRQEVAGNSRVAQNIDHSRSNVVASWTNGDRTATGYGSGYTRQVVLDTEVDIYKAHWNGPMEMYAPDINPHRSLYMYRIYHGRDTGTPIVIWGTKSASPPRLEDRLHLKLIHPELAETLATKADPSTSTAKYDGSSAYIVITPKGTTVWSPRQSVRTGEQIEYTFKLDGIANTHSDETIVAMGEVLFKDNGLYLPSAGGSGILNSNDLLPSHIEPEIRLYRVDRVGRRNTTNLGFWENRELQYQVASLNPNRLKVVELMDPDTAYTLGYEGVVVIPEGGSVNDGFKLKWWGDASDWRIDRIAFEQGPKGGMAGVLYATSLESGKTFKLGPGQVGDHELVQAMIDHPERYEGTVIKVNSKRGHEGRAAKVVSLHDDKGFAPV
jgi:hypothetical protein